MANFPCSGYSSNEAVAPNCSSVDSTIIVTNFFLNTGSGYDKFEIYLDNVTNPSTDATTSPILISIERPSGAVIESDSTTLTITATPAILNSYSITPSSLNPTTTFSIKYRPTYLSPAGSVLKVVFPYWNSALNPPQSLLVQMLEGDSLTCVSISGISSSLNCFYSASNLTLTVTNGFVNDNSDHIEFTASTFRNPPNQNSLCGIYIHLQDANGYNYEVSNSTCITGFLITSSSQNLGSNFTANTTISALTTLNMNFTTQNPLGPGFLIQISLAPEFTFDNSLIVVGVSGIQAGTLQRNVTVGSITIATPSYTPEGNVEIQLIGVTNPLSTQPTGSTLISTMTPSYLNIDQITFGSFTCTPGTIFQNSNKPMVSALISTVGLVTTYYFEFFFPHPLLQGAVINIIFPSTVTPASRGASTLCSDLITNITQSATCEVVSQVLTVYGGFNSTLAAGSAVKFGIDLITNPPSTQPTDSFVIQTFTDSTFVYIIDGISTGVIVTATPGVLTSVTVNPSSYVTGEITTYDFKVLTVTTIPIGGSLLITFPSGIRIFNITSAQETCTKIAGFNSTSFGCMVTQSSLNISNSFDLGPFSAGLLEFSVGSIINPLSIQPVGSFIVRTFDSNLFVIDQLTTGISVTMNPSILKQVSISMNSLVNSEITTYRFSITPVKSMPLTSIVVINFPPTITPSSFSCCTPLSNFIVSINCLLENAFTMKAIFSLSKVLNLTDVLLFSMSSVQNSPSTSPSSSFEIYTFDSNYNSLGQITSGITVSTSIPSRISTIKIFASDSRITKPTNYTIIYTPVSTYPIGTTLTILIPKEFILGNVTCYSKVLKINCSASSYQITTTAFDKEISNSTSVEITLSGITNPTTQLKTSAWSILSSIGNYSIDSSSDFTSSFTCSGTCLTCKGSPDTCTTCSGLCATCNQTNCVTCAEKAYFKDNLCVCPLGTFGITTCENTTLTVELIVTNTNNLLLKFSDDLVNEIMLQDLKVTSCIPLNYTLETWDKSRYYIELVISDEVPEQCNVTVNFLHPRQIVSVRNAQINNNSCEGTLNAGTSESVNVKNQQEKAKEAAKKTTITVTATSISVSVMNPDNPQCFWSFINIIQMLCFIKLSSVPLPNRFSGTEYRRH